MLENVRETVATVSQDGAHQLEYLNSIGLPKGVDELALDLEHVLMVAKTLARQGEISDKAVAAIAAIDQKFLEMTDNTDLWTIEALKESEHWVEIRALAKAALYSLPC